MTDVGDSVERVETLLEELSDFQKSSQVCICYNTLLFKKKSVLTGNIRLTMRIIF